tara:strand:- start:13 stop:705 length:693 start_codon:yes stop_codon:yes gene_type:complete
MKKLFTATAVLFATFTINAQCDNAYFPLSDGVTFEQTSYNAKGKEEGKTSSVVSSDSDTKALVSNKIYDKKGDLVTEGDYEVICEDGKIKMDIEQFIPDEMLNSYENMEVIVEGDFLEFPNELSVGQNLPEGNGKITIKMGEGAVNMIMNMTFTNRKVEAQESLTTPAGTFDTYKISQTTISEMEIMGMKREMTFTSTSWIAEGVGNVKTENYDKKGKLQSYTELTSFSK